MNFKDILVPIFLFLLVGCGTEDVNENVHQTDWTAKKADPALYQDAQSWYTYLPVYSRVYSMSSSETRAVTAMVSIHNMNMNDSIFIIRADYFNTQGAFVRSYIEEPIFLTAMETIDIVIHERDNLGGTGANFLIEWRKNNSQANAPLVEAVMISTNGQQGISFTTRGVILDSPLKAEEPTVEAESADTTQLN